VRNVIFCLSLLGSLQAPRRQWSNVTAKRCRRPGLPLFTENARAGSLGNRHSYTRIRIRYRSVGKRSFACSLNYREEFFSETGRPA
jgi:hypothetical protein